MVDLLLLLGVTHQEDVSDDMCAGFSADLWLFGSSIVALSVVLFGLLCLSLLAMPGLCCFLRVTHREDG